jgi:isoamylase
VARTILPGRSYPLGAIWDGRGVNFAVFAEHAERVDLCLFASTAPGAPAETVTLPEFIGHVWHGYLPGIRPGQLYGYRVYGPFKPEEGQRYNPAKLLIDPYARALAGQVNWEAPMFAYQLGSVDADLSYNDEDDAWGAQKGVVIDSRFNWEDDRPPRVPWRQSIIYEAHVKGFTKCRNDIPAALRGTYAGMASEPSIAYLRDLGVTAVELLPVHAFVDDKHLLDRGLRNYWGYNTINFFAPDARYSSSGDHGEQVREFKEMVKALHRAGIEVILDVVYNHTAEGNEMGPTLSFRGLDNQTYYRLVPDQPRYYMDYTGTGNTPNTRQPQVIKLIMDSLRYWVQEMHVDGFRFDLAAALARGLNDVDKLSVFLDTIHQDPVISTVKLIAEPWDVGEGGYQVGQFPVLWAEWNGKYRDSIRRYWRGDDGQLPELASRLTGSSDLYESDGRRPYASVNFVTAHDGFTLQDLVSYEMKHNEANGEDNRDGANDNYSWNCGVEGPTSDPGVRALRERQQRNFMATLLLSQGVPMICGGDEIGRSQQGNNNAYCQDNEISWYNWDIDERRRAMLDFTRRVIALRCTHPGLRRRKFFKGHVLHGSRLKDITWLRPNGREMRAKDWLTGWTRTLGARIGGGLIGDIDERGKPIRDDTMLILLNAHSDEIPFTLPSGSSNRGAWQMEIDTRWPTGVAEQARLAPGAQYLLVGHSMAVMRYVR